MSFLDEPEDEAKPIAAGLSAKLFLGLLTIAMVILGIAWNPVVAFTTRAVAGMG